MTWGPLTQVLTVIADLIAMGALGLTGDVFAWIFLVPVLIGALRFGLKKSFIADRFLFSGMLMIICSAGYFAMTTRLHPLLVAAHLAVVLHALLWWSRSDSRNQAIRIGMGFVDLALAGAINPDFQTGVVIFLYMVIASVSVSCQYIAQEFREKSPELLDRRVPRDFLSTSTAVALLTFLASLILFPILPRTQEGMSWGTALGALSKTGYTEEVNLSTERRWGSEDQKPAVRLLIGAEARDPHFQRWIPYGLLRGRSLDFFDGRTWKPSVEVRFGKSSSKKILTEQKFHGNISDSSVYSATFEVIREALGSAVLPTPYLTRLVYSSTESGQFRRSVSGDWSGVGSADRRQTHYRVELSASSRLTQTPTQEHLEGSLDWSQADRTHRERWVRLSENLFRDTSTHAQKIEKVKSYFLSGAFRTHLEEAEIGDKGNKEIQPSVNVSQFLFERRQGHCELFATAAALLLRSGGVPARLVSGFRVSKAPVGEVLTLRQSDAHAWVEAWDPARGWVPLDPTPLQATLGWGALDWVRGMMDTASVYWSLYVVGFESGRLRVQARDFLGEVARDFRELPKQSWGGVKLWVEKFGSLLLGLGVLVLLGAGVWMRSGFRWNRGRPWFRAEETQGSSVATKTKSRSRARARLFGVEKGV
jgi:hypothetical protein